MQVTCNAYTFERYSPMACLYYSLALQTLEGFVIWIFFLSGHKTAKIDLLLAQYNLRHFVCVIVLIIYIFNVDVAGSVHFNVVADDLTVVTKI